MRRLRQIVRFLRALLAARTVQDFLWGAVPGKRPQTTFDGWVDVIASRVEKLGAVHNGNASWKVEARKRLLQIAACAIAMTEWIDQQ